jgi:hypothetical protein
MGGIALTFDRAKSILVRQLFVHSIAIYIFSENTKKTISSRQFACFIISISISISSSNQCRHHKLFAFDIWKDSYPIPIQMWS